MTHDITPEELAELSVIRQVETSKKKKPHEEHYNLHGVANTFKTIDLQFGSEMQFMTDDGHRISDNDGATLALHLLESLDKAGYAIVKKSTSPVQILQPDSDKAPPTPDYIL